MEVLSAPGPQVCLRVPLSREHVVSGEHPFLGALPLMALPMLLPLHLVSFGKGVPRAHHDSFQVQIQLTTPQPRGEQEEIQGKEANVKIKA